MKRQQGSFWRYAVMAAALAVAACAPSTDPIDRLNVMYDEIARILREQPDDAKEKKAKIEAYWKSKKPEAAIIQRQIEQEIASADGGAARELFVKKFDSFIARIRVIQALMKEKGIEL